MPTYEFCCDKCGKSIDLILKIADRETPIGTSCKECGEGKLQRIQSAVPFGDPVRMGVIKPDSRLKERLQQIHASTPGSQIDKTSTFTKL